MPISHCQHWQDIIFFCLISTQFPNCNCSVSNILRITKTWKWKLGRDKTKLSCLVANSVPTANTDKTKQFSLVHVRGVKWALQSTGHLFKLSHSAESPVWSPGYKNIACCISWLEVIEAYQIRVCDCSCVLMLSAGDAVQPGDLLCDIQTDKAVVGFETEDEGILAKILVRLCSSNYHNENTREVLREVRISHYGRQSQWCDLLAGAP